MRPTVQIVAIKRNENHKHLYQFIQPMNRHLIILVYIQFKRDAVTSYYGFLRGIKVILLSILLYKQCNYHVMLLYYILCRVFL